MGQSDVAPTKAGDTLFRAGDKGDGCYRLNKGVLKVSLTSSEGDERIVAVLPKGSVLGDLAMTRWTAKVGVDRGSE